MAESLKPIDMSDNEPPSTEKRPGRPPFWEMFFGGLENLLCLPERLFWLLCYHLILMWSVLSELFSQAIRVVMGLKNKDPNSWMIICGLYADLPKELIIATKEEKRARIYFRS
jgi:hypothetical protein